MIRYSKTLYLAVAVFSTAFLISCDSDDDNNSAADSAFRSELMTIHASPDAPAVDLLIDNVVEGTGLTFPNNTGYFGVESGARNVKVNVSGTSTSVIDADVTFLQGTAYSIFAIDMVSDIRPLVLVDDLSEPLAGNAHIRFVHLSPDAPTVDVGLTGGGVVFGGVSFGESDNDGEFTPLPAGTYDLEVRLADTATVVLPLPGINLEDGAIYTVFAKGFAAPGREPGLGAEIIVNRTY
jgi:uncharacterized protein DUF4397